MPQDVLIQQNERGLYTLALNSGGTDFASADGFETAIPVALFTDARAPASKVNDPKRRRGWVGNLKTIDLNRELGGLLWLFKQSRLTATTLNDLRNAATGALNYMLEDGIITALEVTVEVEGLRGVVINITLRNVDNDVSQYSVLWRRTDTSLI